MKVWLVLSFLWSGTSFLCAQPVAPKISLGVKYLGLSVHLKKSPHPQLYKLNLDRSGYAVLNHGLVFNFEYYLYEDLAFRFSQALIGFDCAGKFHGATQLGLSYGYRPNDGPDEIRLCAGPIWFYRQSWKALPGYQDDGLFSVSPSGKWQRKFVWHGAEIEYNHWYNNQTAFSLNWLPGIPEVFTFAPGLKFSRF